VTLYFFGAILSVILGSLLLSLLTKSRERYWEIAGGAVVLIVLIVGLMVRNARSVASPIVPHDVSQSAAVSVFLQQ
jgi:high-affinity Fe2+/Pb2+ permease